MLPNDSATINSTAKPAPEPFFFVGDERDERLAGAKVAVAVTVNFLLKDGSRERSHGIPIHEIPLLRLLYSEGTVDPVAKWVAGVDRRRQLTQAEFNNEFERLSTSYIIPQGTGRRDLFAEVYGATPNEQRANLHRKMFEIAKAWTALEKDAVKRVQAKFPGETIHPLRMHGEVGNVVTPEEMEALVAIVQPAQIKLESIPLDQVTMEGLNEMVEREREAMPLSPAAGEPVIAAEQQLVDALVAKGITEKSALELTTLAMELPDGLPDDMLVTIDGMTKADGSLNKARVTLVKKVIADWRALNPAQTA